MTSSRARSTHRGESGQTLVMGVLVMTVVLGLAAVVVDGGNLLLQRRNLQGIADAAALAAGRDISTSHGAAEATARTYVADNNSGIGASVESIGWSGSRMTVTVSRQVAGSLLGVLGVTSPTVRAHATVELSRMAARSSGGFIPIGIMRDSFTYGTAYGVKDDNPANGNTGALSPQNTPSHCLISNGAADFSDMLQGTAAGGKDSCPYDIDSTMYSETGVMTEKTKTALDARVPTSNHQSFSDVFEYDPSSGRYLVKDPTSPRLVLMPVIELASSGSNSWTSSTGKSELVRVKSYVMAYLGKQSRPPNYPTWTLEANGAKPTVWVTPVNAILAPNYRGELEQHTGSGSTSTMPTLVRLVD